MNNILIFNIFLIKLHIRYKFIDKNANLIYFLINFIFLQSAN
jgi:hypothetical protein